MIILLLAGVGCSVRDFGFGFFQTTCSAPRAASLGNQDGQAGNTSQPGLANASHCVGEDYNEVMFEKDYLAAYQKGLTIFCAPHAARSFGRLLAMDLDSKLAIDGRFQPCESSSTSPEQLEALARTAYEAELANQCTVIEAGVRGRKAARNNFPSQNTVLRKLQVCPNEKHAALANAFQSAYTSEKELMTRERELELQEERLKLERERLELEREKKRTGSGSSTVIQFTSEGQNLEAHCRINFEEEDEAIVKIRRVNSDYDSISLYGHWKIEVYSHTQGFLGSVKKRTSQRVSGNSVREFDVSIYSLDYQNSDYCIARYLN